MYDSRSQRQAVDRWVNAQDKCPTRKQAKREFPEVYLQHIRAAIQSRKDRERGDQA